MKTLAIVRDNRIVSLDHYKYLTRLLISFITTNNNIPDGLRVSLPKNITLISETYYKAIGVDPTEIYSPGLFNLSWKYIANLPKHLANADIIDISDTYYFWNYQTITYAHKKNIPVVSNIWCNTPFHISGKIPPYSFLTRKVIEGTNLFILRNHKAIEFTRSLKIPDNKTKIIYQGVDLLRFKPTMREAETINILYVGLLDDSKGVPDIITAYKHLYKKYKNIHLTIAGNGRLKNYVLEAARELPITYHGYVQYDKLPEIYQTADIFCSPSREVKLFGNLLWGEYFSYTLMEAQASGLPIVSTQVGGIPEEIGNDNLLIKSRDTAALQKSLESLILDKSARIRIGQDNRLRAERLYDAQRQAQIYEQAILDLCLR